MSTLASHQIQCQVPWFRALTQQCDLTVYFAQHPGAPVQGEGISQIFPWGVVLALGYRSTILPTLAPNTVT
jgi:hypothetical protein